MILTTCDTWDDPPSHQSSRVWKGLPKVKTPGMMPQTPTPQAGAPAMWLAIFLCSPYDISLKQSTCHFNGHSFPVGLNPHGLISHCVDVWASIFLWSDNIWGHFHHHWSMDTSMELWYEQGLHARLKPFLSFFCPGKATVTKARRPMGSSVGSEKVVLGHPFNRNYLKYKCEYIIGHP